MLNKISRKLSVTALPLALLAFSSAWAKPVNEVSYYVETTDRTVLRTLFERFDMEKKQGAGYVVVVRPEDTGALLAVVPSARRVEPTHEITASRHSADSVPTELNQIAADHPRLASTENYGQSDDGRPLTAILLTSFSMFRDTKPQIMITSATHGDEGDTVDLTMSIIDKLVQGYGTDARITSLLDKHALYFIPVVSPDGYAEHSRFADGVDPNRNYPYPDDPDHKPIAELANEITWVAKHDFKGSMDIHENLSKVMYPWAYTNDRPQAADIPVFQALVQQLAQVTGYQPGQISDIFGIAQGSSADYWYWKHKTIALGYEMSGGQPDQDTEAVLQFIEHF